MPSQSYNWAVRFSTGGDISELDASKSPELKFRSATARLGRSRLSYNDRDRAKDARLAQQIKKDVHRTPLTAASATEELTTQERARRSNSLYKVSVCARINSLAANHGAYCVGLAAERDQSPVARRCCWRTQRTTPRWGTARGTSLARLAPYAFPMCGEQHLYAHRVVGVLVLAFAWRRFAARSMNFVVALALRMGLSDEESFWLGTQHPQRLGSSSGAAIAFFVAEQTLRCSEKPGRNRELRLLDGGDGGRGGGSAYLRAPAARAPASRSACVVTGDVLAPAQGGSSPRMNPRRIRVCSGSPPGGDGAQCEPLHRALVAAALSQCVQRRGPRGLLGHAYVLSAPHRRCVLSSKQIFLRRDTHWLLTVACSDGRTRQGRATGDHVCSSGNPQAQHHSGMV
eukprot:scaffold772_cov361-Prasinococcus_capsulatus_cf.AAC.6